MSSPEERGDQPGPATPEEDASDAPAPDGFGPATEAGESDQTSPEGPAADGFGPATEAADAGDEGPHDKEPSVADVLAEVERERDHFKDLALRTQAELENFRKQTIKRQTEALSRAAEGVVVQLLPVLDAFDAARSHSPDSTELDALWSALWGVLAKEGLERIDAPDERFDPTRHEAVSTLPAGEGEEEGTVATVMRTGYVFKGRVLRAAMVAVRG